MLLGYTPLGQYGRNRLVMSMFLKTNSSVFSSPLRKPPIQTLAYRQRQLPSRFCSNNQPTLDEDASVLARMRRQYNRLQTKWLNPFMQGFRGLYRDNKEAWRLQKEVQLGQLVMPTRKQALLMRQAPRDLMKTLPLALFFCVPIVGYLAPVVGFRFPKLLLSSQFWTREQKLEFYTEGSDTRKKIYQQLALTYKHKGLETNQSPDKFMQHASIFETQDLAKLPQKQLQLLAQAREISPLTILLPYCPSIFLVKPMKRLAHDISSDDALLWNENTETLTLDELQFACSERGIQQDYSSEEKLRNALNKWLRMIHLNKIKSPVLSMHLPVFVDFDGGKVV